MPHASEDPSDSVDGTVHEITGGELLATDICEDESYAPSPSPSDREPAPGSTCRLPPSPAIEPTDQVLISAPGNPQSRGGAVPPLGS